MQGWERNEGVMEHGRWGRYWDVNLSKQYFHLFFQAEWIRWEHKGGEKQKFQQDPSLFRSQEKGSDEGRAKHPVLKILHCLRWAFKYLPLSSCLWNLSSYLSALLTHYLINTWNMKTPGNLNLSCMNYCKSMLFFGQIQLSTVLPKADKIIQIFKKYFSYLYFWVNYYSSAQAQTVFLI